MLDRLDSWLGEFPPLENAQRFGNKAFRSWVLKLNEVMTLLTLCIDLVRLTRDLYNSPLER